MGLSAIEANAASAADRATPHQAGEWLTQLRNITVFANIRRRDIVVTNIVEIGN